MELVLGLEELVCLVVVVVVISSTISPTSRSVSAPGHVVDIRCM